MSFPSSSLIEDFEFQIAQASRFFLGRDRAAPRSERSSPLIEKLERDPALALFNPFAENAATISLSGFSGPCGLRSFNEKSSSQGKSSQHEALGNVWLKTGNCPIAKSYRAVSGVLPLIAKILQPPDNRYRCPPAIVAAQAAIARTAFAKNLRPQPLPAMILTIGVLGVAANVSLGIWREHTKKFSPSWFAAVHPTVPFVAMLRKSVLAPKAAMAPKSAMAFTIAALILCLVIGFMAGRSRMKAASAKSLGVEENNVRRSCPFGTVKAKGIHCGNVHGSSPSETVKAKGIHCGSDVGWGGASIQVVGPTASADAFCMFEVNATVCHPWGLYLGLLRLLSVSAASQE